jgi:hypothetical protein
MNNNQFKEIKIVWRKLSQRKKILGLLVIWRVLLNTNQKFISRTPIENSIQYHINKFDYFFYLRIFNLTIVK